MDNATSSSSMSSGIGVSRSPSPSFKGIRGSGNSHYRSSRLERKAGKKAGKKSEVLKSYKDAATQTPEARKTPREQERAQALDCPPLRATTSYDVEYPPLYSSEGEDEDEIEVRTWPGLGRAAGQRRSRIPSCWHRRPQPIG